MNIHKNAKLTPQGRYILCTRIIDQGWSVIDAAAAASVSVKTARKWVSRYQNGGEGGLHDRSSRPKHSPASTPDEWVDVIVALRGIGMSGPHIAWICKIAVSTVGVILKRAGLGKTHWHHPPRPIRRYEKQKPGELIHIDIKKLARFDRPGHRFRPDHKIMSKQAGWEYLHVCIDDYSRIAYAEVLENEKADTATGFLERAVGFYRSHGIIVQQVMTDNGGCYRSIFHAMACKELGVKHIKTKPYTPQTNGKAERFIRTLLTEWAYVRCYQSSKHRAETLKPYLHRYNHQRPHTALGREPPITRKTEQPV